MEFRKFKAVIIPLVIQAEKVFRQSIYRITNYTPTTKEGHPNKVYSSLRR